MNRMFSFAFALHTFGVIRRTKYGQVVIIRIVQERNLCVADFRGEYGHRRMEQTSRVTFPAKTRETRCRVEIDRCSHDH